MGQALHTIAYTSNNTIPRADFMDEIQSIIGAAQGYNPDAEITGVLLYSNNRFMQILEGELPALKKLMANIEADSRHDDVQYLVEKPIQKRGFDAWAMDFYNIDEPEKFSAENLQKIRDGLDVNELYSAQDILGFCNKLF